MNWKTSGKFRPLKCKNWENGANWPTWRVSTGHKRWTAQWRCVHACALRTSQSRAGLGAWLVAFDAGPSQTLPRRRRRRDMWARPAFGRVNASITNIDTSLLWKTNGTSYVTYQMALLPMTLNDLAGRFCCLRPV